MGLPWGDFPGVERQGDAGVWEYRTRRLVLEAWGEDLGQKQGENGGPAILGYCTPVISGTAGSFWILLQFVNIFIRKPGCRFYICI